jgi:predicted dehydrogenase
MTGSIDVRHGSDIEPAVGTAVRDADPAESRAGDPTVAERGPVPATPPAGAAIPRIAFLGVGWIGRDRMAAVARSGLAEIVGIADPSPEMRDSASELAPHAVRATRLDELLGLEPDGIVIATPSALHAEQAIAVLRHGRSVFCQKPLGRTASEVTAVVQAARDADRLLSVDFSYRFTEGMSRIRELVASGELGHLFAADLVFHNAYGPDKPWFYDAALSGGGCVMDLGIHLVDLVLWIFESSQVREVDAHLLSAGRPMRAGSDLVEDYATADLRLEDGASIRLVCSWKLHAGQDTVIAASFYGTEGGASFSNVGGSFYDFTAARFQGTSREEIATPPDAWSGRAIVEWAGKISAGGHYDPSAEGLVRVADVVDRIYRR